MQKITPLKGRLLSALQEDGAFSDLTTLALPKRRSTLQAQIVAKSEGVFSGGHLASRVLKLLDARSSVRLLVKEGAKVRKGTKLARVKAVFNAIVAGERLILNLICHLSGVATLTRRYVDVVRGTPARIVDTRKTMPLWRDLEREAVAAGGGLNHRFSLADAVLVKDNHWAIINRDGITLENVYGARSAVRRKSSFVAIEAVDRNQVWQAIKARADIILLDNMPENRIKEAVVLIRAARKACGTRTPLIEVSGGITPDLARRLARLGVDRISVGALTHSAPALDISLEID